MLKSFHKLFLLLILGTFTISVEAQTNRENLPYSYFGIGDIRHSSPVVNKAMGGMQTAFRSGLSVVYSNPASYSSILRPTLETSIFGHYVTLNDSDTSQASGGAGIDNLNIAFPIGNKWGTCIGVRPYSSVNYYIRDDRMISETIFQRDDYRGSGSIYEVYLGNAWRYKGLSIGLNLSYLFGSLERSINSANIELEDSWSTLRVDEIYIKGITWRAGVQYEGSLKEGLGYVIGLSGTASSKVDNFISTRWTRGNITSNLADPIYETEETKETLQLAPDVSLGFAINSTKNWIVGVDYTVTQWTKFKSNSIQAGFVDSWRLSLGAGFTPDIGTRNSYLKSVNYRLGVYYDSNYLEVENTRLPEFGLTFGGGFPLKRSVFGGFGNLNFSVDIGQRGTLDNNLIRENFIRGNLGVTFNGDRTWFQKRKFD